MLPRSRPRLPSPRVLCCRARGGTPVLPVALSSFRGGFVAVSTATALAVAVASVGATVKTPLAAKVNAMMVHLDGVWLKQHERQTHRRMLAISPPTAAYLHVHPNNNLYQYDSRFRLPPML